ncbi:Fatty acid resistance protein FarB [Candidatus Entotheonellaceae bacterium PAL068K]
MVETTGNGCNPNPYISMDRSQTETMTVMLLGLIACSGGGLFILRELFARFPAVNLRLFRLPAFCLLCSAAACTTLGLFGAQFMISIFLQHVMGFSPLQAGLIIVPALVVSAFGGTLSGRLSNTISPRLLILLGFTRLVIVFRLFSSVSALTASGVLVDYFMLYRMCLFSINTPLTALNVRLHQADQVRMGQGLLGMVRNIGAALGVTISSVIFERRSAHHQLLAYTNYNAASPEHTATAREIAQSLRDAGLNETDIGAMTLRTIRRQMDIGAVAVGFRDSFFAFGFCFLLALLPMLFITNSPHQKPVTW